MPKRISNRIDFWLMAYKGAKPQKAKVTPTVSAYGPTNQTSFSGPFGSGSSAINPYTYTDPLTGKASTKNQIDTSMSLSQPLQQAGNTASTGLNSNLAYLQRDPTEQVNHLTSGGDPLYNVLHEQSQRAYDQNLGRLKLDAQQSGSGNSTAAGAAYGRLMGDKGLIDNQNLYQGLTYGNQTATQNANTNLGAIGSLAQTVYPLGSAANAQLNTAVSGQDRAQAATAQAQNTAENNYTQSTNQYNANKAAGMGSGIGSIIGTVGGAALGSVVPGIGTAIGASIGGSLGGKIGGGGGAQYSSPVYIPQTFGSNYSYPDYGSTPNLGNVSGYGSNSPLFTNLSSPVY